MPSCTRRSLTSAETVGSRGGVISLKNQCCASKSPELLSSEQRILSHQLGAAKSRTEHQEQPVEENRGVQGCSVPCLAAQGMQDLLPARPCCCWALSPVCRRLLPALHPRGAAAAAAERGWWEGAAPGTSCQGEPSSFPTRWHPGDGAK